ncbi:MAG: hypothetical protein ACI8YQ_004609 [Polaribacter sp.]|jgi:hypothetical protein
MSKKTGRNAKCPCGSGKKYKKCCIDSGRSFFTQPPENPSHTIFSHFDSIDLIKIFSGLTLLPQNHGKNVRFEELARGAIACYNQDKPQIPERELQFFLDEHYPTHYLEDPATNLFTDLVTFHDADYIIFPGITDGGSYVLSNQLAAIQKSPNSGVSDQFKSNCMHASLLILGLSNLIAQRLGYTRYIPEEVANNQISFPNTTTLAELKCAVSFTEDEIHQFLKVQQIAPEALAMFTLDLNDPAVANPDIEESPLLVKPIIHHNGKFIISSPATLSYALVNFINSQADLTGISPNLSSVYHNLLWNTTQLQLTQLGFTPLEVPAVAELKDPGIRESIYRFDNDKLAYVKYATTGDSNNQDRKQQIINAVLAQPEFADHEFMDLTLVSSIGRDMFHMDIVTDNSKSIGIPIHDFDTLVKLNEHTAIDLWKFANARDAQIQDQHMFGTSFLDLFKVFKDNGDSFYISDNELGVVFHVAPGYACNLYQEAKLLKDEHSIKRVIEGKITNIPVVLKDKFAPIYYSIKELSRGDLMLAVEGFTQPIWVTPNKNAATIPSDASNLYFEMTDTIAYWLWQCQPFITKDLAALGATPITFVFKFDQEDQFIFIERNFVRDPALADHFTFNSADHIITISIPSAIIPYLYGSDNEGERELIRQFLQGLNQLLNNNHLPTIEAARINQIVDQAAPLGVKKKVFILDTANNLLLDLSHLGPHRYVQPYDINVVLDSLVPCLGNLCPPVGHVTQKAAKTKLTRDIVMRVLLPKLQATISQYQHEPLLQRLISLNESLIQKREDLRIKTPTRIACFVSIEQQSIDLQESLSKLNQTTIAVRCLIEHLAAQPTIGNKTVSTTAIDELIAIMHGIIDWGSMGDQIEFELFEIEMSILPSGRVGTEKTLVKEIFDPYQSSKSNENVRDAIETFEQAFPQLNPIERADVPKSLDNAFVDEFGISFTRICQVVSDLGIIAYQQPSACATMPKNELFIEINNHGNTYSEEEFSTAIHYLSLFNRGRVQDFPAGFDNNDIKPWRFNRRLSLLRKPLVLLDNPSDPDNPIVYWGFRQLLTSRMYWQDQCTTNRLKVSEEGPVQRVLGKLAQRNGKALVESVLAEVENDELIIDSEVLINTKSELKADNDLGDVDVLVIDKSTKTIYSLECKSMAPSRNIKEMVEEVSKLFGSDSKKGWIDKHVGRDAWLKENLDQLGAKYDLDLSGYTVKSFFITQEDMLTPYLKTRQLAMPFISLYTLKEKGMDALKN